MDAPFRTFFCGRWVERCEACGGAFALPNATEITTTEDRDATGKKILTCGCTDIARADAERARLLALDKREGERRRRAELRRMAK